MIKELSKLIYAEYEDYPGNSHACLILRGYWYKNNHAIFDVFPLVHHIKKGTKKLNLLLYTESTICRSEEQFSKAFDALYYNLSSNSNINQDKNRVIILDVCDRLDIEMYPFVKNDQFDTIQILYTESEDCKLVEYIGMVRNFDLVDVYIREADTVEDLLSSELVLDDYQYELSDFDA